MPLVSITRLRVRSWRFLPAFFVYALRSAREASRAEGNLAARLLRDRNLTFWTSTLWTTDAAMKAFMLAGAHRKAMPRLQRWCDEASVVHWLQPHSELPQWAEAHARLQREGRASKVKFPSSSHAALRFPEPVTRPHADTRLK